MIDRRNFLKYTALGSLYPLVAGCQPSVRWQPQAFRKKSRSRVAVLAAKSYDLPLKDIIVRGIRMFGLEVKGKRIVLKPNLVEFDPKGAELIADISERSSRVRINRRPDGSITNW